MYASAALLGAAIFFVCYAVFAVRHSDFNNDDLDNFLLAKDMGLWRFLLLPTNVHHVPGHRLLTWVAYASSPMNFKFAIVLIMFIQALATGYLYGALRLMRIDVAGVYVVTGYALSSIVVFTVVWFAHAQHRVPYVLMDLCAIYHYLAWLKQGGWRHGVMVVVAFVLAFCFYEKAILIPIHLLVLGFLYSRVMGLGKPTWSSTSLPLTLLAFSAFYVVVYLLMNKLRIEEQFQTMLRLEPGAKLRESFAHMSPFDIKLVLLKMGLDSELEFVKTFFAGITALASEGSWDIPYRSFSLRMAIIVACYAGLIVWIIRRAPGSGEVILGLGALVLVGYAPIAFSDRGMIWGHVVTHQYRYFLEEWHFVALAAGLCFACYARAHGQPLRSVRQMAIGLLVLAFYAAGNWIDLRHATNVASASSLTYYVYAHDYMHNLRKGMARIGDRAPRFENSPVPPYMSIFGFVRETRLLVPLFVPNAIVDATAGPRYRIQENGRIEAIASDSPRQESTP